MKKVWKIMLVIALVFIIAISALVIWQWSNVKALFISFNLSDDKINTLIEENDIKTNDVLSEITDENMRNLSEEERKMLGEGLLSEEEAVRIIRGQTTPDKANTQNQNSKETEKIISQIYLLRAEYLNALDSLVGEAKSYYLSIPSSERTLAKKASFAETYTGKAVALEKQCDARMNNLLSQLKVVLEKEKKDLSIISEIKSLYNSEKELKKSALINKYSSYIR